MASSFTPDQNALGQLMDALSKTSHPDNAIQQQVQQFLSQFSQNPLYAHYLAYIFANPAVNAEVRRMAGLLVKTVVANA
ncbi:hypothetical protein HDU99_002389, partial [Rhizoclosmatium hyalinum]